MSHSSGGAHDSSSHISYTEIQAIIAARRIPLGLPFPQRGNSFSLTPPVLPLQIQQVPGLCPKSAGGRESKGGWVVLSAGPCPSAIPSNCRSPGLSRLYSSCHQGFEEAERHPHYSVCSFVRSLTHSFKEMNAAVSAYCVLQTDDLFC